MEDKLYILELEDGKYYVGKTTDVKKRFEQHASGKGAEWTKIHKPLKLVETRRITSEHDENNLTKDLMKKYGMENVRGGAYASINISEEQETVLRHEMKSNTDTCYKCGKAGHFASSCKKKSSFKGVCQCGKEFLVFEDFISHQKLCIPRHQTWQCDYCDKEFDSEQKAETHEQYCKFAKIARNIGRMKLESRTKEVVCYRCDRPGHYSTQCYAYTDSDGGYIGKPRRDPRNDWSDDDSD